LLAHAERLFLERGYDNVTVAEIADAAEVSVKTLFVYFRSKEDLVFADTTLLDALVDGLRHRSAGTSPAQAVGHVLRQAIDGPETDATGIEGYQRRIGNSEALRSRLPRMWADYEDTLVKVLAEPTGAPPTPATRLTAIALVGVARSFTSPEVRQLVADSPDTEAATLRRWLDAAIAQLDATARASPG